MLWPVAGTRFRHGFCRCFMPMAYLVIVTVVCAWHKTLKLARFLLACTPCGLWWSGCGPHGPVMHRCVVILYKVLISSIYLYIYTKYSPMWCINHTLLQTRICPGPGTVLARGKRRAKTAWAEVWHDSCLSKIYARSACKNRARPPTPR